MFIKKSNFQFTDIIPLNVPTIKYDFIVDPNVKVSAEKYNHIKTSISKSDKQHDFDLENEIKNHPDSLYVKCFAIEADVMNENGDYFGKEELKKAYSTFVGVPVYTNHQNTDINQARGKVVYSWWDEEKNGINVIMRVDAAAYPQLARGIKQEYISSTSMGAAVKYSICSICHNCSEQPSDYCSHIKEQKTRTISAGKIKCEYHKFGKEEKCPLCSSEKNNIKSYAVNNQKAFEYNYGVKFIENSFVSNPAFVNCGVIEIIDPQKFINKVAEISKLLPILLKQAAETNAICDDKKCVKLAGQKEIGDLNQALDLVTTVSQSMLKQKDQLDLEFLSDLIKVLSDLQQVTDELTEQGYGRLQSPDPNAPDQPTNSTQQPTQPTAQQSPQPSLPGPNGTATMSAGPGTATVPKGVASTTLNFEKLGNILHKKLVDINSMTIKLNELKNNITNKEINIKFKVKKI